MSVLFGLRFDFRNPAFAGTTCAERYAAALDMAEWADELGCVNIAVSEHHASPDGYLPSPLTMLAAMAARTANVRFLVAALVAPFYDPLRLAEDMVVLDHLSRGRVDLVVAGGYVREEFAMFGVPMGERAQRVTETPDVWDFYRDEVQQLGRPDRGPSPIGDNRTVVLAKDVETGWQQMAPFFLHETNAYGAWQAQDDIASPYRIVDSIDELKAKGQYAVLTPDELVAELMAAPFPFVMFHPLCGGIPPELAWSSLRLFEKDVLPAFA